MSWHGTSGSTLVWSPSSARTVSAASRAQITWPCTGNATCWCEQGPQGPDNQPLLSPELVEPWAIFYHRDEQPNCSCSKALFKHTNVTSLHVSFTCLHPIPDIYLCVLCYLPFVQFPLLVRGLSNINRRTCTHYIPRHTYTWTKPTLSHRLPLWVRHKQWESCFIMYAK